jgi:NAD(P)-dependent dehydrogenase (short-subunit alcohol dehydrogenase family)
MSSLDYRNLFDISGKVVLVTGGSRGIGKMVGRSLPDANSS